MAAAVALPQAQPLSTDEKVTTVPNPANNVPASPPSSEDTLVASSQGLQDGQDGAHDDTPAAKGETNGYPETYAAVAAQPQDGQNGAHDGTPATEGETNGHPKSYAAVAANPPSTYPPLDPNAPRNSHERHALRAAGIRFVPMQVPLTRRLQTAAVLFHCMSIVLWVSIFWFTCANPFSWPLLVPYLIHLSASTAATNGTLAYRSEWLRSLPLWRLFAGYFPMRLHKTHELPADKKYIFGYHPHGIISHGAWCAFATNALGFREKFPGITNTLVTLDSNFRLPFYRDWALAMGLRSVSKESIWNILTKGGPKNDGAGRAVTIVIGGARESLEAQPYSLRLILEGRKGFIKMALRTGADLVPVMAFGENDLYDQLSPRTHPLVHKLQMVTLKLFKFTVPALHGRGLLNYDVGLMPYRRPVNIVMGKPIDIGGSRGAQPSQEDIDRYHELYVQGVEALWETYKDTFATGRKGEMEIIS